LTVLFDFFFSLQMVKLIHVIGTLFFLSLFLIVSSAYCSSGATSTEDTTLGTVSLRGDTTSISDDSSICPGYVGVRDLTSQIADLIPGASYSLIFTVTTCGSVYRAVTGAWIDYNQNGTYDTNESLFPFTTSYSTSTRTFTVPSTINNGRTRLRVQTQEQATATSISPCALFAYGGTKEFSIMIGAERPTDAFFTSLPAKIIFGTAGGVVVIAVILILLFAPCLKRRRQQEGDHGIEGQGEGAQREGSQVEGVARGPDIAPYPLQGLNPLSGHHVHEGYQSLPDQREGEPDPPPFKM